MCGYNSSVSFQLFTTLNINDTVVIISFIIEHNYTIYKTETMDMYSRQYSHECISSIKVCDMYCQGPTSTLV